MCFFAKCSVIVGTKAKMDAESRPVFSMDITSTFDHICTQDGFLNDSHLGYHIISGAPEL